MTNTVPIMPGAEPLFHRGGRRGVLFLHGFLGSPFEMKHPAEALIREGYTVSVPRLPGHGTSLEDMTRTCNRDWHDEARRAYRELSSQCDDIYVAGLSMGGILTILLAAEFDPGKIIIISAPRRIPDRRAVFAPLVRPFAKILPIEDEEKGIADPKARETHVCYGNGIPVLQVWHLRQLINAAMRALPRVISPALIIQSRNDRVIPSDSLDYISGRIGSAQVEKRWLDRGNHTLTVDYDRDEVAREISAFIAE